MFNLRSLFNLRRFVGCQNPRQRFSSTSDGDASPLSLRCEETPEGGAQLVLDAAGQRLLPQEYPLPPDVYERCEFWNNWVSHALETEWEHPLSPYGPEAYAAAIAISIATACPDRTVDWCGLPVHDDYALYQYACEHTLVSLGEPKWDKHAPRVPLVCQKSRYLRDLMASETLDKYPAAAAIRQEYFIDWGPNHIWYEGDTRNRYDISRDEGFPHWLVTLTRQLEERLEDSRFWYIHGKEQPILWEPCPLTTSLVQDALSIDILRYLPEQVAVSSSPRYRARPEDFPPVT